VVCDGRCVTFSFCQALSAGMVAVVVTSSLPVLVAGSVSGTAVMRGTGEDVEAEVAPSFCPFVVLFGQDGPDEADQRVAVGEDPDHVGAAADLAIEPLGGVVRPNLAPQLLRAKLVNAKTSTRAVSRCWATFGHGQARSCRYMWTSQLLAEIPAGPWQGIRWSDSEQVVPGVGPRITRAVPAVCASHCVRTSSTACSSAARA